MRGKVAIVVYGCGPQDSDDELTPVGRLNTEAAAKLFKLLHQKGVKGVKLIPTGGKTGKAKYTEAEVMKKLMRKLGIPESYIISERAATNTIENVVFVANIKDRMGFTHLIHVSTAHHLNRIRELCYLVGISNISEFRAAQEILGKNHPLVEETKEILEVQARNEARWMRGLREIPEYWLPQTAKIESLQRFRDILKLGRIQKWLKENFSVNKVSNLTNREIEEIKEKIGKINRVMP